MISLHLKPGDIFFSRGDGIFSAMIRFCTRTIGEKRTKVNHSGVIVTEGDVREAILVEGLLVTQRHSLWEHYGPSNKKTKVAIYRPKGLSAEEIQKVVKKAESYVGRKYGIPKLILHFLDWIFFGVYFFRRLAREEKYPICSWVVAYAFEEVKPKFFGIEPNAAVPDDIWDHVVENHSEDFIEVYKLDYLNDVQATDAN